MWQCDSASARTFDTILTTFNGDSVTSAYSPVFYTPTDSSYSQSTDTSPSEQTQTAPARPSKHGPPIGAIVGGVIAGVAVVGGIVVGIIFWCLRKRSTPHNIPTESSPVYNGPEPASSGQPEQFISPTQSQYTNNRMSFYPSLPGPSPQAQYGAKPPLETVTFISNPHAPTYYQATASPAVMQETSFSSRPEPNIAELGGSVAIPKYGADGQQIYEAQA
jgi:hypothetical protein